MAKKRGPGRPKGSGVDLTEHLSYMAEEICRRQFRGERDAARASLQHHRGDHVTERHLTRVYAEQRRELEVRAMRRLATWNTRFWLAGAVLCGPDRWETLLRYTEGLAVEDSSLRDLAGRLYSEVWRHLRHLPFPLHRLYPQELLDLLREAGLEPPPGY